MKTGTGSWTMKTLSGAGPQRKGWMSQMGIDTA